MNATREQIGIVNRMYETQEAAQQIFGEKYTEKVAPWIEMLELLQSKLECGVIQAVLYATNPNAGHGETLSDIDVMLINAAAVDLLEAGETGNESSA